MNNTPVTRRRTLATLGSTLLAATPWAQAHDFRAGDLVIDHPYATPSIPGAANGAAYFRGIRNRGSAPDHLIAASSPVAQRVELHEMTMEGGIMRMREVDGIALPPGQTVSMRHGQGYHLMLMNLKAPLADGERFDLTLRFERAGEVTVKAWVQRPSTKAPTHSHDHSH